MSDSMGYYKDRISAEKDKTEFSKNIAPGIVRKTEILIK